MKPVLSVASECAPLVKTGGLADVTGALPAALRTQGVDMRTLLPAYPQIRKQVEMGETVLVEDDLFGGRAELRRARLGALDLYLLDAPHLFDREGSIYLGPDGEDWPDNPERFAALSWIAARLGAEGHGDWAPQVVHCHDWQAGLAPVYLHAMGAAGRVKTVITVHNVAFQGLAPADRLDRLRLPRWAWHPDGLEYWGQISALKAGLVYADRLTTVSPTYARELMRPEFGMGLDGVLRARHADLCGILNGIDVEAWDPAADSAIVPYRQPRGKAKNRRALLDEFGLPDGDGPLAVVISRLTEQKGLDLLLDVLPPFLGQGGRLALLGSGNRAFEAAWRAASDSYEGLSVRIGYDETLSHRMIAGGDAIIVPSRFEPCGLTQLYGLRYGTVPVVALTGGLADTVIPANDASLRRGVATGVQFAPVTSDALADALGRLCELYAQDKLWEKLQRNAMKHPVGWDVSAAEYAALYDRLGTHT
ncbi:glycogen synthase GlgA [Tranquillimonas alkanivorans]|uniref:Glycogen synthase n=1 Tax=Tranquillimonas alkanivorans TaxID=441119 RepID=A0A1I5RGA0_9RHOB|nr:glycogen synthase GlgA [Tranquillimonas alkanivorans]SFP57599.1 starch synthase [Tranquillimonas alkanivorans]